MTTTRTPSSFSGNNKSVEIRINGRDGGDRRDDDRYYASGAAAGGEDEALEDDDAVYHEDDREGSDEGEGEDLLDNMEG